MTHETAVTDADGTTTRRIASLALGTAGAGLLGVAVGWLQPMGPTTAAGALALMAGGTAVGLLIGALARTRWLLLAAPLAFVLVFELSRSGQGLPTAGPLALDAGYGLVAWLLGRILPWTLAPIGVLLGIGWGLWSTHRRSRPVWLLVWTALTIALGGSLLLPASSPALRDSSGEPIREAVSELVSVELGGHRQWIQVRGASADLPVLLYLSGGPGQSDLAFSRVLFEPLTSDFLVVGWDQRGTGKSYPALDADGLTLERAVDDTIELAGLLARRYRQEKVYLLGESWGSILGVLAVQKAPELFHAYLGSGQMVAPRATDEAIYEALVSTAMAAGDGELTAALASMGPPPYQGGTLDYARIYSLYSVLESDYTPPEAYRRRGSGAGLGPWGVFGSEYGPIEKLNVVRGLLDMHSVMYPQLQDLDLRRSATRLEVPVYVLNGEPELMARTQPATEWFEQLRAPSKRWYSLPDSGHSVAFEQADELRRILVDDVGVR